MSKSVSALPLTSLSVANSLNTIFNAPPRGRNKAKRLKAASEVDKLFEQLKKEAVNSLDKEFLVKDVALTECEIIVGTIDPIKIQGHCITSDAKNDALWDLFVTLLTKMSHLDRFHKPLLDLTAICFCLELILPHVLLHRLQPHTLPACVHLPTVVLGLHPNAKFLASKLAPKPTFTNNRSQDLGREV
ncbi:hypothetical protein HDU93_004353 [Gonapodya sp. JEL0774]|nr:hypothetical protein HDU93_004353 [Gonapodya sp. JEL0774]